MTNIEEEVVDVDGSKMVSTALEMTETGFSMATIIFNELGTVLGEYYDEDSTLGNILATTYDFIRKIQESEDDEIYFVLNWDTPLLTEPTIEQHLLYLDGNTLLVTLGLVGVMAENIWQTGDTREYTQQALEVFTGQPIDQLLAVAYGKGIFAYNLIQSIRMVAAEGINEKGMPNIDVSLNPYEYLVDSSK